MRALVLLAGLALAATLLAPAAAATRPPADAEAPCGVASDPACWAPRFACQMYGPLVTGTPLAGCRNLTEAALDAGAVRVVGLELVETKCENFGVIIMVTGLGTNRYCVDGECSNAGLIVMVGYSESCYGRGYGTVCVTETCVVGPDGVREVGTLRGAAG